jgi:hypothetical protein
MKKFYILNKIKMKLNFKNLISWFAVGVMILTNVLSPIVNAYSSGDAHTSFIMPNHDVTLKATSKANNYTIVFNANGWTGTMSNLPMTYDQTWSLTPNSFNRTWYTFFEWNTKSDWTWTGYSDWVGVKNLATTWNVTLYAIWTANTYKVVFDKNDDIDTLNVATWSMWDQSFTYDEYQNLTENSFVRTWYNFAWWSKTAWWSVIYTDGESVHNLATTWTVTLYAKWTAKTWVAYKVQHYKQNIWWSGWTLAETDNLSGTTYQEVTPSGNVYTWFTFSWTETQNIKWDGSTVFKYYYTRNQYLVTLNAGRWIEDVSWAWLYYYIEDVSVSAVYKTWYENLIWTWTKNTGDFKMPATGVVMTANATPIDYKITVDVWSGTMPWWDEIHYNVEDVASGFVLPDPTRTWYDFVWWSWTTTSWTTTTWYELPEGTYGDIDLEAVWQARTDVEYTVHHYIKKIWVDEYVQDSYKTYTGEADHTLILQDLKKTIDCMTYTWWSLTMSTWWLTDAITETTILPDGTRHIYLYYTRNIHTVTLTKDDWISTVLFTTKDVECGDKVDISATPKTWYTFKTWEITNPTSWVPVSVTP